MSSSSDFEDVPPFTSLTEYLQKELKSNGFINKIPAEVIKLFSGARTPLESNSLRGFVKLFEGRNHDNCLRLIGSPLSNVVCILLHLPYSHSLERLIFSFMSTVESLRDHQEMRRKVQRFSDQNIKTKDIESRRRKINDKLIPKAIQVIGEKGWDLRLRILAAQVALVLIHDDPSAHDFVHSKSGICQILGCTVMDETDNSLRLVTANLIRELHSQNRPELATFWPPSTAPADYKDFPLSQAADSAWLGRMADFLNDKDANRGFHGDFQTSTYRLLSLQAGRASHQDPNGNILVVVSDRVTFIIPGEASAHLILVEIPLDTIVDCEVDEQNSPGFVSNGENIFVEIEYQKGKGYQVTRGAKSAVDNVNVAMANLDEADTFVKNVKRVAKQRPRNQDNFTVIGSNHTCPSHSSDQRVDVGLVDLGVESEEENRGNGSSSEMDSLLESETPSKLPGVSRQIQQARQSSLNSRRTLSKDNRHTQSWEPDNAHLRESLELGNTPNWVGNALQIDDQLQKIPNRQEVSEDADGRGSELETRAVEIDVDFNQYLPEPDRLGSSFNNENTRKEGANVTSVQPCLPRSAASEAQDSKDFEATQPHKQKKYLQKLAKKATNVPANKYSLQKLPPKVADNQSSEVFMSPQTKTVDEASSRQPSTRAKAKKSQATAGAPSESTSGMSQPCQILAKASTQAPTHSLLKRPINSRPSQPASHPLGWDDGNLLDEDDEPPVSKKPKLLQKKTPQNTERKSQRTADLIEETGGAADKAESSILKRPKTAKKHSQASQAKKFSDLKSVDDFDIDAHLEPEEAPAPQASKASRKVPKAAKGKKFEIKTRGSKKEVTKRSRKAKSTARKRLVKGESLVKTRSKRVQPISTTYVESSDSELENLDEHIEDEEVMAIRPKTVPSPVSKGKERGTERDSTPGANDPARSETPARITHFLASPSAARTIKASTKEKDDICLHQEVEGHPRDAETGENLNMEGGAEDSVPKNDVHIAKPSVSFGSRVNQILESQKAAAAKKKQQKQTQKKAPTVLTTPFGDTKTFVASVNANRSVSPKKKARLSDATKKLTTESADVRQVSAPIEVTENIPTPMHPEVPFTELPSRYAANAEEALSQAVETLIHINQDVEVLVQDATGLASDLGVTIEKTQHHSNQQSSWSEAHESTTETASTDQTEVLVKDQVNQARNTTIVSKDMPKAWPPPVVVQTADAQLVSLRKLELADCTGAFDEATDKNSVNEHIENAQSSPKPPKRSMKRLARASKPEKPINERVKTTRPARDTRKMGKAPGSSKTPKVQPHIRKQGTTERQTPGFQPGAAMNNLVDTTLQKKSPLVHFNSAGPSNQGIASPEKHSRKSLLALVSPAESAEYHTFNQRHSIAAIAQGKLAIYQADIQPAVSQGDLFEQKGALLQDEFMVMSESGAMAEIPHRPAPIEDLGKSASQGSGVDEDGSSRLPPQRNSRVSMISPQHDTDLSLNAAEETQDIITSEGLESENVEELESQGSDSSFKPVQAPPKLERSDRSTRKGFQKTVIITIASPPPPPPPPPLAAAKLISNMALKAEMKERAPRGSIGLGAMTQEQYPLAEKEISTVGFKKPDLKSAITQPLATSKEIPQRFAKTIAPLVQGTRARSRALSKPRTDDRRPIPTNTSSPEQHYEPFSAAPSHVRKLDSRTFMIVESPCNVFTSTPASFSTRLLAMQSPHTLKIDDAIAANLKRGKSAHRDPEEADLTLVDQDTKDQPVRYYSPDTGRVRAIESPIQSRSPSIRVRAVSKEPQIVQGKVMDLQGTNQVLRDILDEMTKNVLFRLQNEEDAIGFKVNEYRSGGNKILEQFQQANQSVRVHEKRELLKKVKTFEQGLIEIFKHMRTRAVVVRDRIFPERMVAIIKGRQALVLATIEELIEEQKIYEDEEEE